MLFPKPQPDESEFGLLGRIRILNGLESAKETLLQLRDFLKVDVKKNDLPHLLAQATNISFGEFVRRHTLAPFKLAFSYSRTQTTHAERASSYLGEIYKERVATSRGRFCAQCSMEDVTSLGFSYWRRSHQVPGITWCAIHKQELLVAVKRNPFRDMPSDHCSATAANAVGPTGIWTNPVAQNYADLCFAILDRAAPINIGDTERFIARSVRELNLSTAAVSRAPRTMLSDVAERLLSSTWLEKEFSMTYQRGPRAFVGPLNKTVGHRGQSAPAHYVLALALIRTPEARSIALQMSKEKQLRNHVLPTEFSPDTETVSGVGDIPSAIAA